MRMPLSPEFQTQPESTGIPERISRQLRIKPWLRDPAPAILFKNATIIVPEESSLLLNHSVLIVEGKVKSVGTNISSIQGSEDLQNDGKLTVVDLEGRFLCPGLIDCHVHVTAVPGVKTMGEAINMSEDAKNLRSTYVLREMLARGFTTVRDTGGANSVLANAIDEWLIPGPRLIQCGKALSQTGGHGDFRSTDGPVQSMSCCGGHQHGLATTCDGVPQVLTTVRDEIRRGAKFIKLMCGGGVASPTDLLESIQFTAEEVRAITTTCEQMGGLHTTAHAYSVPAILHAINNGVKGIEHGNFIDKPTAEIMAKKGVFLTPTLSCYGIMVRPPFEDFLPEDGKEKNAEVMKAGLEAIKIAEEAGVIVCYGTDLLVSMHALQTEEFSVRAQALPSPTVLKHATTNAARLLRLEGKVGTIRPGAYADLIVLDANPLEDITVLDQPHEHLLAVIKEGYVFRSRLESLPIYTEASW